MIVFKFRQFIHRSFHNPESFVILVFYRHKSDSQYLSVFTEPFSITGKLVLLLFPLGLYLLFFSLSKDTGLIQLVLFPFTFSPRFPVGTFYLLEKR